MKVLALILLLASPSCAQWRPVTVSSDTGTASITENFRRASMWSNRKLDRFSSDTVYGQPVFQNGIKYADSTIQTTAFSSSTAYAVLSATQTFTGQNTFIATSTTTFGYIDIGRELITNACGVVASCTATCSAGKKTIGGGCALSGSAPLSQSYPTDTTYVCTISAGGPTVNAYVICARIK